MYYFYILNIISSSLLNKIRWTSQMCIPFKVYSHLVLATLFSVESHASSHLGLTLTYNKHFYIKLLPI
jgi:hypothetical protein